MGVLDKKFQTHLGLFLFIDTPSGGGSTTLSASAAAGATTLSLTSAANFAIGDDIRVGTGETMELVRISNLVTTTVTTAKPTKFAHASAEAVVEQSHLNIGVPEADGLRLNINGESTDVFSSIQRLAYGIVNGFVDLGATFRFPVVTADVIAFALGIPRANVIGDGTAVQQTGTVGPRMFTTDGTLFGGLTNVNLVSTGQMQDGSYLKVDLYNITFDPTSLSVQFARGQLSTVPVKVMASSGAYDFTNTAWTPANTFSTNASSKADIFSEIVQASVLTDSGTSNTTSGVTAAGAYVIALTSATGFTANSWVKIGTGDAAEYHLIHAVATNNLNLRTQVLRAFAATAPVVQQTVTSLGVAVGGFTLGMSGSVETQRAETYKTSLGYRVLNCAATLSWNVDSLSQVAVYTALGIPAADVANNVVPLGARILANAAATILFTGLTQGGRTVTICGWNGAAQVGGETQFSTQATASIPMSFKPNGLQVLVNV